MDIEEIRKNKPEGATHYVYDESKVLFLQICDSGLIDFISINAWKGYWGYLMDCHRSVLSENKIKPL